MRRRGATGSAGPQGPGARRELIAGGRSAGRAGGAYGAPVSTDSDHAALDAVLIGVVAAGVYAAHGFHGALGRDLGIFVYGGQRIADGHPPYAANFNTVGPLSDALPGLAIEVGRVIGVGPVLSARLLAWVFASACVSMIYLGARRLTGSRWGGAVGAALFLPLEGFVTLASDGPREKTAMVFFLVVAVLLLDRSRWLGAGVATGLGVLCWQPVMFALAPAAAVLILVAPARIRAVALFVLGGGATAFAALAWAAATGSLHAAMRGFVTVNLRYVRQPSALADPRATWDIVWSGYHWSLVIVFGGLLALLVSGAVAFRRPRNPVRMAIALAGLGAAVWTATAINGFPDLFVVLPFGAWGAAIVLHGAARRLPSYGPPVLIVISVACLVAATTFAVHTRSDLLVLQAKDAQRVLHRLPSGSGFATIDAPEPLIFTGRTNPEPYLILDSGELGLFEHTWQGGTRGYVRSLLRGDPAVLAIGAGPGMDEIDDVLHPRYWFAGGAPGWNWYVARSAGVRLCRVIVTANHRALAGSHPRYRGTSPAWTGISAPRGPHAPRCGRPAH